MIYAWDSYWICYELIVTVDNTIKIIIIYNMVFIGVIKI